MSLGNEPVTRVLRRLALILLAAVAPVLPAAAAVPGVINYQGRLTDNSPAQTPVSGTLPIEFSIWDDLLGGSSLWNETQSVQVVGGLFSTILGQVTPIPPTVFSGGTERYLEIRVSGETLTPRQRIAATPFAHVAGSADDAAGMDGLPASAWQQRIASACPDGMAVNAVAANGTVTCVATSSSGCIGADCRSSWNNQDPDSVNPMPRTCAAGQVALSTGPYQWACSTLCGFAVADCNNNINDGCETTVTTNVDNCGGCGNVCSANGIPARSCSFGLCNGACSPSLADCNANKLTDGCERNLASDADNCNACGTVCSANNMATRTCAGGFCNGSCFAGFGDCNANKLTDGCEISIATDPNNCNACGVVCSASNMTTRTCGDGICNGTCFAGFSDCNNNKLTDGCETNIAGSATNCGSCGVICSSNNIVNISCGGGICNGLCVAGFGDCNNNRLTDGCERNIRTDADNCNACGAVCSGNNMATRTCSNGICDGACSPGFGDCNNNKLTDGCERNLGTDPDNCNACGIVCEFTNMATRTCSGGVCDGTCEPGFSDCNSNKQVDGCEIWLNGDPNNCGACGHACGAGMACVNGDCV